TAREIHVALTEPLTTPRTCEVLVRVGRALGAREGTGPEDDPLLGALLGRERTAGQADLVGSILRERGIAVPESFAARAAETIDSGRGARMPAAALACADEADFWRRLNEDAPEP
ncbi:MAG: hypothetical protein OXH04_23485, partial [Acidobacteria bacterium]|nr:hypothetical protein [Acidobacteriota bacterium]